MKEIIWRCDGCKEKFDEGLLNIIVTIEGDSDEFCLCDKCMERLFRRMVDKSSMRIKRNFCKMFCEVELRSALYDLNLDNRCHVRDLNSVVKKPVHTEFQLSDVENNLEYKRLKESREKIDIPPFPYSPEIKEGDKK